MHAGASRRRFVPSGRATETLPAISFWGGDLESRRSLLVAGAAGTVACTQERCPVLGSAGWCSPRGTVGDSRRLEAVRLRRREIGSDVAIFVSS